MQPPGDEMAWAEWRGSINEWRTNADVRFKAIERRQHEFDVEQDRLDRELTRLTTKIAIAAGVGAVGGGALVTIILAIATKALGL